MAPRKPAGIPVIKKGRLGSLFKVPIDYILETSDGDFITLPNTPSFYMQSRPSASVLTYTLTGVVKESVAHRNTMIELRGQSGYTARSGYNRDGDLINQTGMIILEEFDHWLNLWQKDKATQNQYLIFRSLKEGFAYKVKVEKWEWQKDAEANRFSYAWNLSLHAYGDPTDDSILTDIFSPVSDFINEVVDVIDVANATISLVGNAAININNGARSLLRAPFDAITRSMNTFSSLMNVVKNGLFQIPSDALNRTFNLLDTFENLLDSTLFGDDFDTLNFKSTIALAKKATLEYSYLVGGVATGGVSIAYDQFALDSRVEPRNNTISIEYVLQANQGIRDISFLVYGDRNQFQRILDFNRMLDERTHANGQPLQAGDTLFIPQLIESDNNVYPKKGDTTFFTDLKLDSTGDLVLKDSDLATISGVDNLKQGLINRLLTEQGTFRYSPSYGIPAIIGASVDSKTVAILSSTINNQLRSDPRISSVKDVNILVDGDQLAVSCESLVINGSKIPLIIPIRETI